MHSARTSLAAILVAGVAITSGSVYHQHARRTRHARRKVHIEERKWLIDVRWFMKLTIPVACLTISLTVLASCTAPERASEDNTAAAEPTPDEIKQMQQEAGKIIEQQIGNLQKKEAATFPCSLFPQQEIEALAGNSLDPGSYTFNHVSEDGHDYRSESCDWSAKGGEGNEVGLWVSLPRHFSSGNVECSVGSANQKTSGIGDQAWWQFQKYFGMGTLRVCSANAMLEVKVKLTSKDEVAARKVAQTMAEKVLASS